MGRCRVVVPDVVRLPLTDGDYVDVKKRLNAGEYVELVQGLSAQNYYAKVLIYLVGWSLVGLKGEPLAYSVDLPEAARLALVKSVDGETFSEIMGAINTHHLEQEKASSERKNAPDGGIATSSISPSVA